MRRDDERLIDLAGRATVRASSSPSSRNRTTTGSSSPRRCSRTARSVMSIARSSCPRTGSSTSAASSRRRHDPGDRQPVGSAARDLRLRGLLASRHPAAARPRRRADPGQRVVVPGAGRGGDQRAGPRDGGLVADPESHLRAAHDELRHLREPGRGRRVHHVLGRLRGRGTHGRDRVRGAHARRGAVLRRHRHRLDCAGSASPPRCCATSVRRSCSASSTTSSGSDRAPRRRLRTTDGRRGRVRAAGGARDRHGVGAADHHRVHRGPARTGRLRTGVAGPLRGGRLGPRGVSRRRGHRPRAPARGPHAVSDVVARVAGRRGGGRSTARLRERGRRHQPDGRRLFHRPKSAATRPPCDAATSWRGPG